MLDEAIRTAGVAAGVPFLAIPPGSGPRRSAPIVVAWHMLDAPRTQSAFAAALPLEGLDAWRVYLGLPKTGSRLPEGGWDELFRLGAEDAVLQLHGPIVEQAAAELPAALAELRVRLGAGEGTVGLLGASIGSAVAQLVLAEGELEAQAAVLVSPVAQLRDFVDATARGFGFSYPWSERSRAVADRLDFVARAGEIAARGRPAVLLALGERDDAQGIRLPTERLRDSLARAYDEPTRVELVTVPGMAHALAEEPGIEPAPQTRHAAAVDRIAVGWLRRHLHA